MKHITLVIFFLCALMLPMSPKAHAQRLIWVEGSFASPKLRSVLLGGSDLRTLDLDPASIPEGIALDNTGAIFWSELRFQDARIHRTGPALTDPVVLVSGGSAFRGITVDPRSGIVYWVSSNLRTGSRVFRYTPSSGSVDTLAILGPRSNPRGLVLDTLANNLYWCEYDKGTISSLVTAVPGTPADFATGLGGPIGLALDPASSMLYWTEMTGNRIQKKPLVGGQTIPVFEGLSRPGYLALDLAGQRIVWTELQPARVLIRNMNGANPFVLPIVMSVPGGIAIASSPATAIDTENETPVELSLFQNYPNPFNPSTTIQYALPRKGYVTLEVFSVLGERVALLQDGSQEAGRYTVTFGGRSGGNASGIYFYRLSVGGAVRMKSMVYLK